MLRSYSSISVKTCHTIVPSIRSFSLFVNKTNSVKPINKTLSIYSPNDKNNLIKETCNKKNVKYYSTATIEDAILPIENAIKNENRRSMTFHEFLNLCQQEAGITSETDARQISQRLNDRGQILHAAGSQDPVLHDTVVIIHQDHRFDDTAARLDNALLLDGQVMEQYQSLQKELADRRRELEEYDREYGALKHRVQKSVSWQLWGGLGYLCIQMGILMRFVWWDFQWDIIEPFTYMVTFTTMMLGYLYFATTKREYTYNNLYDRMVARKLRKSIRKTGFDMDKYEKLQEKIAVLEKEIDNHPLSL